MFIRLCYRHSRLADHIVRIVKIHLYILIVRLLSWIVKLNQHRLDVLINPKYWISWEIIHYYIITGNSLHCKTNMQSYTIPFKSMQMYLCFLSMLSTSFSHHQRNIQTHWHNITNKPSYKQLLMLYNLIKRCTRQWTHRQTDIQKKSKNQLCILKVKY